MDAKKWIERVAHESVNAVAKKIEMTGSTLDSQIKSERGLKPETVISIARAYPPYSPVQALVDFKFLESKEVRDKAKLQPMNVAEALSKASNDELLREIGDRLEREKVTPIKRRSKKRDLSSFDGADEAAARSEDTDPPKMG